jgi:hypothetical protein
MLTVREATERNRVNNIHLSRRDGEYRVTLRELHGTPKGERIAYYTDDLEDAVLTAAAMRQKANKLASA